MKFITVSAALCALSSASALPLDAVSMQKVQVLPDRSTNPVLDLIIASEAKDDDLKAAVDNWKSENPLGPARALIETLKTGAASLSSAPVLSLSQALDLTKSSQDLEAHTKKLVESIKAQRDNAKAAKACGLVRKVIEEVSAASAAVVDATVSKIPLIGQSIARKQSQGTLDAWADAKSFFSETNCA
ncbi:hypothetical protein E4U16_004606 [Claviceps sp. LM84 group G4]|nr:hypothetical protein E4U16_004606 [Claviceps sp. LM84 group G4]KAG6086811.1 hypothetical protein E4U33_000054 [Claviceps sp. LM78 group G4]